jgi:general secretion pathway protein I
VKRGARGFTLLEVAIALAIMGVGVVTVLELFSAGLRMESGASVRSRAVVYARGLLDQTMALPEVRPGNDRGRFDDTYRWEVIVRQAPDDTEDKEKPQHDLAIKNDLTMYEIEVNVLWPQSAKRDGVYTIRTLRLAPKAST